MSQTTTKPVADEINDLLADAAAIERGLPLPSAAENASTGSGGTDGKSEQDLASRESGTDSGAEHDGIQSQSDGEGSTQEGDGQTTTTQQAEPELPKGEKGLEDGRTVSRKEKKAQALERSWENADRRHREADAREKALNQREAQLTQQHQQFQQQVQAVVPNDPLPKYSASDVATTLAELIDEGDLTTAKNLAKQLGAKAEAARLSRSNGMDNPQFRQSWDSMRDRAVAENAELKDEKSPLFKEATDLLTGSWSPVLTAHPAGVLAAVEVAKLRLAAASVPDLQAEVKRLETENAELKRRASIGGSKPVSHVTASENDKFAALPVKDQISALYEQASRV